MNQELGLSIDDTGRRLRRRWPAYLLLALGLVAILAGVSWQVIQGRPGAPNTMHDQGLGLPSQMAGVSASQPEFGANALRTIQSMHGQGFAMVNGAVMHYGSATAWVAQASNQAAAKALADDMTARLANGRSPFTPTGTRQVNGRSVYTLDGLGQSHFYWQSGDKVVWLAIDPDKAEAAVEDLVRAIN